MAKQDIKAGSSYVELLLKDNAFVKGLAAARDKLASFASAAMSAGTTMALALKNVSVDGLKGFMDLGDELDKMRQRTGLSVEALSELRHAAGQSGATLGDVEKGVRRMQKSLVDAQKGTKTAVDAFMDLGLSVSEISKLSPEGQFNAITEAIAAIEDPSRRAGLAMNVFGKSGTQLLPMIEDLSSLRQEARDLGFVLSGEAAASAVRVGDMFANLWSTLKMGPIAIGGAMAPILEVALPAIQKLATEGLKWIQGMAVGIVEVMDGVRVGWSIVWDSIGGIVAAVWGDATTVTQGAMQWFQSTIMTSLKAISFAFKEWKLLTDIAVLTVAHGVVRFANQTIHFFGTVIPDMLQWFGRNWKEVFTDIFNYTGTVLSNLWGNLVEFWAQLFQWMQGGEFAFEWTNLTEGFESAIRELPIIAEREIGGLEKSLADSLDSLNKALGDKWDEHSKDFEQRLEKFRAERAAGAGEAAAPALEAMGGFNMAQAKKEVFVAFSAAAAMAGGRGQGIDAAQETRKEQLKEMRRMRQAVEEGGVLV